MGRAPRTKETLPDFSEWCRVTRHSRVFRGLTSCQRTPGFWGVTFMMSHGYNRTSYDYCLFTRKFSNDDFIILLLHVDDMLIIDHDSRKIDKLKRELSKSFAMKDLGSAKQILGMNISHDMKNRKLWLSQESYI